MFGIYSFVSMILSGLINIPHAILRGLVPRFLETTRSPSYLITY